MSVTRTTDSPLLTLPQVRTALLGRVREADEISRQVTDPDIRLMTLVGPGGVGKTRLALHVATEAVDAFAGDVAFVPLASIREPRLVLLAIGSALGLVAEPDETYGDALADLLRERRMLIVLDNLEQVLDVGPAIGRLLDAAPGVTMLATSQVRLGLPAERTFPLDPLPTLDPATAPLESLVDLDAFGLFVERARAVDPYVDADDPDAARDIARICHRLDGLPLAIELAAARANVMSPRTLLERLENRMSALGEYRGDVPDRLRTMRAAIGWSHDLLDPDEQALFRRLSVFAGGWSGAAASQVYPEGGEGTPALLQALVQRSLVRVAGTVFGDQRYAMLQTLADFGIEMLSRHGEDDAARLAHALSVVRLAEDAEPHLTGSGQQEWMIRLDADMDNIRAAVEWALAHDRIDLALRICGAIWRYFGLRGLVTDARRWLDRALASKHPGLMPYRVKALVGAGYLAEDRRDLDAARDLFQQALHLASAIGDTLAECQALIGLGTVAHDGGDYETARGYHQRSVDLARDHGDRRALAIGYANLGAVTYFQGRLEESLRYFSDGHDILVELGDVNSAAVSVSNMGAIAAELGDFDRAEQHARRALALQRQVNSQRDIPSTLINLGESCREQGKQQEAREAFAEAIRIARENEDRNMVALALHGAAVLEYAEGDVRTSAAQVLESIELLKAINDPHSMVENAHLVALLCLETERFADAAVVIAANNHLSEELGIGLLDARQGKIVQMTATAKAALGDERFTEAQTAGRAMDLDALTRRIERVARAIVGPRHDPVRVDLPAPDAEADAGVEHRLTDRELEILRLLAAGKSTSDIAGELFVSTRTITTHVAHILEKLDLPNRTAAVAYAMREGLV